MKIRLSAFADEASADFGKQLAALNEEHIPFIELRGLDGKNIADLTEEEAKSYKKMLDAHGVAVWSIGSPLGKIDVKDDFSEHEKKAEHLFRLAGIFGAGKVRVFSFYTKSPETDEEEVFSRMRALVSLAGKYGLTLYHENEKEIYGDTAPRCEKLLSAVEGLACVFDPANFVQCGQDVGEALKLLQPKTGYYHIKDALYKDGAVVPAGEGDGRIAEMISGIEKDTVLTLEPHLSVFEGYASIDHTELKNTYTFESPRAAFAAAAEALRGVLRGCGFAEKDGFWEK